MNIEKLSNYIPDLHFFVRNKDSIYVEGNDNFARHLGLANRLKIAGLTDSEVPCKSSELSEEFKKEDQIVLDSQKPLQFLTIAQYTNQDWKILMGSKTPVLSEDGKGMQLFCYQKDITQSAKDIVNITNQFLTHPQARKQSSKGVMQHTYILSDNISAFNPTVPKLSNRESDVLFLIVRGKTAKEVAVILGISFRTVQHHMETLRLKFNCLKKSELIGKAIEQGLNDFVPPHLLNVKL